MNPYELLFVYLSITVLFFTGTIILSRFIRSRGNVDNPDKYETYECGEEPVGDAWIHIPVSFYLIILVFILFGVEAAFLFPWVISLSSLGIFAFIEMFVFILILFMGWLYAFKKGDLKWERH